MLLGDQYHVDCLRGDTVSQCALSLVAVHTTHTALLTTHLDIVRNVMMCAGRGRGRGRRGGDDEKSWVPCTKLGRLVKEKKIKVCR